jgi:hypothetical protein
LEIFWLEKGVLGEQRRAVGLSRKECENVTGGDPHPPNASLPAVLSRLNRYPIKLVHRSHVPSVNSITMAPLFVLELTGESGV